jgi:nucleoporin GLE1
LANLKLRQTNEDNRLKEACSDRGRRLRERIESGIQYEEEKVRAKLEAERKARQEEEKRRQEAEKRRQEEEKAKRQAEEEAARRAREENVRAKEDAKRQAQEEESRRRLASSEGEAKERMRLGFTSVNEDWWFARETLLVWLFIYFCSSKSPSNFLWTVRD